MKKLILLPLLFVCIASYAQVASTECLAELDSIYPSIDHEALLKTDQLTRIRYHHTYIMKTDPDGKKIGGEEWRMYGRGFMQHDSPEFTEVTDGTEAFNYRKYQFVVYRTKSTLKKAGIVPGMDKGILKHCTVRNCEFVPAPNMDSTHLNTAQKRALLTLDEAGQKKYQIKDVQFVWDPLQGNMTSITVSFTSRSLTKWAMYEISAIETDFQPSERPKDAKAVFLDGNGALKDDFKGAKLMDYR